MQIMLLSTDCYMCTKHNIHQYMIGFSTFSCDSTFSCTYSNNQWTQFVDQISGHTSVCLNCEPCVVACTTCTHNFPLMAKFYEKRIEVHCETIQCGVVYTGRNYM